MNTILNSPEKQINLSNSENTKANERDSLDKDENIQNNHENHLNYGNDIIYQNNNGEITKRHRRRKDEITDRNFQCPDCDKCYLSGPALTTHRKTKHGYEINYTGEKKIRGRPKKEDIPQNPTFVAQNKYNSFFKNEMRKPPSLDQTINDKTITLEIIKNNLCDIFRQCHKQLFVKYNNVENYPFYKLIIENWEKEIPNIEQECFYDDNQKNNNGELKKIKSPCIDGLFYLYLREFSKKTNKDYFWFIIKFVVLFRECINQKKEKFVKEEMMTEKKRNYSQIYNAEAIPEMCNDFYIEFMEPNEFYGLNQSELIELIQHFCYWLYCNQYTQSHLTLLQN